MWPALSVRCGRVIVYSPRSVTSKATGAVPSVAIIVVGYTRSATSRGSVPLKASSRASMSWITS